MTPISLLAAQKFAGLLTNSAALQRTLASLSAASAVTIPLITPGQVLLSSAPADMADKNVQLTYPRVCVYSTGFKNSQLEKFRIFSGTAALVADVWASADLMSPLELSLHFYAEAITEILNANRGDWGDGFYFPGAYELQIQLPKAGGFGFVQCARVSFALTVSSN